ncbi:MAG: hypothetical protein Q8O33_06955 [Pseudomonadota bacterium]|nr:hypothetical protein [Pseudomonadota bacterium]
MVTEISGAGLSHSVVSQAGATASQRVVGTVRPDSSGVPRSDVARDKQVSASTQVAGEYAQLRARQDVLNKAASVVREVSDTVEKASQLLDKIENNIGEIVKMYPPYPIDSPQRISLLNNIDGLRKQIDDLTFPPPESVDAVERLLGNQADAVDKEGKGAARQDVLAVVKEQMWDIPTLDPRAASDAEVSKALDQVKAMKSSLEDLKEGMWNDVVSFVKQAQSPEAQNEAVGVREQLADIGDRGIGSNARQLVQAAELK